MAKDYDALGFLEKSSRQMDFDRGLNQARMGMPKPVNFPGIESPTSYAYDRGYQVGDILKKVEEDRIALQEETERFRRMRGAEKRSCIIPLKTPEPICIPALTTLAPKSSGDIFRKFQEQEDIRQFRENLEQSFIRYHRDML